MNLLTCNPDFNGFHLNERHVIVSNYRDMRVFVIESHQGLRNSGEYDSMLNAL